MVSIKNQENLLLDLPHFPSGGISGAKSWTSPVGEECLEEPTLLNMKKMEPVMSAEWLSRKPLELPNSHGRLNREKRSFLPASPPAPTSLSSQNKGFPVKYCSRSLFSFFSFILRFWNHIFTCRSVRFNILDNWSLFSLLMYTLKKNSRSSSRI